MLCARLGGAMAAVGRAIGQCYVCYGVLSKSNECAPHPNTFSYVPSVFVSAQFCATESTEKVFLCTEKVFLCVFSAQKGPQKGPQKHIRKNTISRHIHSTCLISSAHD